MDPQSNSPTYQRVYSPQQYNDNETRLCIIIDSATPILMRVPMPPGRMRLAQFKNLASLNQSHYKFYFKSHDAELGMVKEELVDDDAILPVENGKIVAWVISNDSVQSTLFLDPIETRLPQQNPYRADMLDSGYGQCAMQHAPTAANSREPTYSPLLRAQQTSSTMASPHEHLYDRMTTNFFPEPYAQTSRIIDCRPQANNNLPNRSQSKSSVGFDPATELPHPVIDTTTPINSTEPILIPKRTLPKVGQYDNHRTAHSLPRSITPRSWYTTSNYDNLTSSSDLRCPLDSRSVYEPTTPNSVRQINVALHCGKDDIYTIYQTLKTDAASLDIKDRDWLKVVVKDAFLGSTLVKWLSRNVYGFCNRSEVKRFANQMLTLGLIRSPMSNSSFSEKCYYTLT